MIIFLPSGFLGQKLNLNMTQGNKVLFSVCQNNFFVAQLQIKITVVEGRLDAIVGYV